MGLFGPPNSNGMRQELKECFHDAAAIIEGDSEITVLDLWALTVCFQVALKQIMDNKERASGPRPSLEELANK